MYDKPLDEIAENVGQATRNGVRAVGSAADRAASRAAELAQKGSELAREGTERVRSEIDRASERTLGYVRDEPVRSLLMAAAAGALIMALVRMAGSGTRSYR